MLSRKNPIFKSLVFAGAMFLGCFPAFAADKFVIESRLFRGTKEEATPKPGPQVVIASFSGPVASSSPAAAGEDVISAMKAELADIFHLKYVNHVNTGEILWDGKNDVIRESILLDGKLYPIVLYPKVLSAQKIGMKIEVFQFADQGAGSNAPGWNAQAVKPETRIYTQVRRIESSWGKGERLLDTELTVLLDDHVVVGFPVNDHSYFLSLRVKERPVNKLLAATGKSPVDDEEPFSPGLLNPPKPRLQVIPAYPEACKRKNIEGTVGLRVITDRQGQVESVRVTHSAHPELDLAAREAVRQWRFEPVTLNGKLAKGIFYMSVDFKVKSESSSHF